MYILNYNKTKLDPVKFYNTEACHTRLRIIVIEYKCQVPDGFFSAYLTF